MLAKQGVFARATLIRRFDVALEGATTWRRRRVAKRCACGKPLPSRSRFDRSRKARSGCGGEHNGPPDRNNPKIQSKSSGRTECAAGSGSRAVPTRSGGAKKSPRPLSGSDPIDTISVHLRLAAQGRSGGMADALDSKSSVRKGVWVRVPPSVLFLSSSAADSPLAPGAATVLRSVRRGSVGPTRRIRASPSPATLLPAAGALPSQGVFQ